MLVQVSEEEINNQIASLFYAGGIFPSALSVPVDIQGVVGTALLNFTAPTVDLDRPGQQMCMIIPFTDSEFAITAPREATLAPLGGTITVLHSIGVVSQGYSQIVVMDFTEGTPQVSVSFDADSQNQIAIALSMAGLTLDQVQNMVAELVNEELQTGVRRIDLTPPIPAGDDTNPTRIFDLDVTTVGTSTGADRSCMAFGVRTSSASGGNINSVTNSYLPAGSESLVMMSNWWLLADMMRPMMAEELEADVSAFDTPLRLNSDIQVPGEDAILSQLEARVQDDRIRFEGQVNDSGRGWSATADFTFFVNITLTDGEVIISPSEPDVDLDVDLAWWVWLAGLGLGALVGRVVGIIVAAILLAILKAAAGSIAGNLAAGALADTLDGMPGIPLGPIGEGLEVTDVILDDLEFRGSIIRSFSVPVINEGRHLAADGFTLDLDTGTIGTSVGFATDLVWEPNVGLSTVGPTALSITGTAFGALTPVQIAQLPLSEHSIPLTSLPTNPPPTANAVVFGLCTTDGRYAKMRAWLDSERGNNLHVQWKTFDTPTPQMEIAAGWSALQEKEGQQYHALDGSLCRRNSVRWRGVFEAWPTQMVFPIDYQWCLRGEVLQEGKSSVAVPGGSLICHVRGRHLQIEAEALGQNVVGELCVSAIDARGQELFTCIQLSQSGEHVVCQQVGRLGDVRLELVRPAKELGTWRPLIDELKLRSRA